MAVADEIADRTILHQVLLERLKRSEAERVLRFLQRDVLGDVAKRMERALARGTSTARLQALDAETRRILSSGFSVAYKSTRERLTEIGVEEARWQRDVIQEKSPLRVSLSLPNVATIRSALTSKPFEGKLLKDWFGELGGATQRDIRQQLTLGLAQGDSTEQIVRRVTGTRSAAFRDGVAGRRSRQATAVVRTAVNHVSSEARARLFRDNQDVVKGMEILATLDHKTSHTCQVLDGKVIPVDQTEESKPGSPPYHHQCRTTLVPVLRSFRELGIRGIREPKPGTRFARGKFQERMNGQPSERLKYPQWLRQQPKAVQNEILGPSRARLFRQRAFDVQEFIDFKTLRVRTLAELAERERRVFGVPRTQLSKAVKLRKIAELEERIRTENPTPSRLKYYQKRIRDYRVGLEDGGPIPKVVAPKPAPAPGAEPESDRPLTGAETRARIERLLSETSGRDPDEVMGEIGDAVLEQQRFMERTGYKLPSSMTSAEKNELKGLQKRVRGLNDELSKVSGDPRLRTAEIHALLRAERPVGRALSIDVSGRERTAASNAQLKTANEAREFLSSIVDERALDGELNVRVMVDSKSGRAFARPERKVVVLFKNDKTAVYVHEMSHVIELQGRNWRRTKEFLRRRGAADPRGARQLRKITGRSFHGPDEKTFEDEFMDPYMGRIYDDSDSTEILSMGMEELYRDPVRLMREDPEMFDFIVDLIHGS